MPVEHFRSKEAYRKFNAYRHIHGIPAPNLKVAVVAGRPHNVKHSSVSKRRRRGLRASKRDYDRAFGG